jgi:23S rRNA-/tRNA-specific pseudouridylate synthase
MHRYPSHQGRSESEGFQSPARPPRRQSPGEVLFADDHLVVVAKASGACAEVSREDEPGVASLLVEAGYFSDEESVEPLYPVEPPVSGVVVYARGQESHANLMRQAAADELVLECLAIVRGHILQDQGALDAEIPQRLKVGPILSHLAARPAPPTTHWKLKDSFVGFALLECRPQPTLPILVRSQLESTHIPLAVDSLFGGGQELLLSSFKAGYHRSQRREERPLISRVSLHASSVSFLHPVSGQPMRLEAPLPKDMKATLHQLDRFGRLPK